ncbi:MAG: hypothetical protein MJY68_00705 [Bacteroidaceae bacterium]|nr:hypothetical protein [Bacteroidaceae bacterium]
MDNIFKLLLSTALLLCCLTASVAGTQPSAGDGLQANPYEIATSDNLVWFAEHVNYGNASACAKLMVNNAAIEGVTNADIIAIATNAINAATNVHEINVIKEQTLAAIASAKAVYASVLGDLGTPQTGCAAVKVTKGERR